MCTKCGYTTVNTYTTAKNAQEIQNALTIGNTSAAFIGNLINGLCSSSGNNTQAPTTNNRSTAPQDSKTVEETKTVEDPKEQEEKVKTLLGETTFNALSDDIKKEVLKKYSTIKEYSANNNINVTDEEMTRRLSNYAKALSNIAKAESGFAQGDKNASYEIAGVDAAIKENNENKYKAAFYQTAEEYIELCEGAKSDGRINLTEYLAKETADAGIDIKNLNDSDASTVLEQTKITFQVLDLDNSGYLEKDEVAGMLNCIAVQDNDGRNITYQDNQSFGQGLRNYATAVLQLNKTDTKTFISFFQENRSAALEFLKEKTDLTKDEFNVISNTIKGHRNITEAFTSE